MKFPDDLNEKFQKAKEYSLDKLESTKQEASKTFDKDLKPRIKKFQDQAEQKFQESNLASDIRTKRNEFIRKSTYDYRKHTVVMGTGLTFLLSRGVFGRLRNATLFGVFAAFAILPEAFN